MINLLPPQQKEELRQEQKLKLILIFGILLVSFLVSLFLILSLVRNLIEAKSEYFKEEDKDMAIIQAEEGKIKEANLMFSQLDNFYSGQIRLVAYLEKISRLTPEGVHLTNFNFSPDQKKGKNQISFSGFSPDRKTLLLLKENLEKEQGFSEIYFPAENWVKPTDINFTVSFKIAGQ